MNVLAVRENLVVKIIPRYGKYYNINRHRLCFCSHLEKTMA